MRERALKLLLLSFTAVTTAYPQEGGSSINSPPGVNINPGGNNVPGGNNTPGGVNGGVSGGGVSGGGGGTILLAGGLDEKQVAAFARTNGFLVLAKILSEGPSSDGMVELLLTLVFWRRFVCLFICCQFIN